MTDSTPASSFTISDALEIFERRKWWLLSASIVGLGLGAVLWVVLTPVYASRTTILVEPQAVPDSYVRSTVTMKVRQRLETLEDRVTSHESLNSLIDSVGPERIDPTGKLKRGQIMHMIRSNIQLNMPRANDGATVFQVEYRSRDPQLAAEIVRGIADLFISENIKDRARQAASTSEFLNQELDRLREEVDRSEKEVRTFRSERMGSLPSQLEANLRSLDRLNLELNSNLESQVAASQRISLLRRQAGGVSSDGTTTLAAAPSALVTAHRQAEQELLTARGIYTDNHPNVRHLIDEVARLQREIEQAPPEQLQRSAAADPLSRALGREIEAALLDLDAKKRREGKIRGDLAGLQARVEVTPQAEQELQTLTRDYEELTGTYRMLLTKKHAAAIAQNLEQAQKGERFKLLRPAHVPSKPAWPDPLILIPGGVGLGLALALLGIGVGEFRHPAFRSVDRLTRMIGLPVFASIPMIDNDAIYEEAPNNDVDPKLVVYTAPESSPAEQYRGILPLILESEDCRVILVTSAASGDGKTLTCMNIAASLACDIRRRVLVIDGDLRRPAAHKVLRLSRDVGLSDVLTNQADMKDCAINSKIPNLALLPAGPRPKNPLALLTSDEFLKLIEEAKKDYDLIVIDSPPLLPVVDTKILRRIADMVLFVVRADGTPREAVLRSLDNMRGVAGVVFNQVSPGSFRRYYRYDAYARYAYGLDPDEREGENEIDGV